MARLLIDDGQTQTKSVTPDGQAAALEVTFRPPLPTRVLSYTRDAYEHSPVGDKRAALLIDFLAAHLVKWDATDATGKEVPVSPQALARLPEVYLFAVEEVLIVAAREVPKQLGN